MVTPRNQRIEGFSITANVSSSEDAPRGLNDVTVYRAVRAPYADGYCNRMYTGISSHSFRRVLRAIEHLIVTRPDWRMVDERWMQRGVK